MSDLPSTIPFSERPLPVSKPLDRATAAGEAAARRMDELQVGTYFRRQPPTASGLVGTRPQPYDGYKFSQTGSSHASVALAPCGSHNNSDVDDAEQQRLYKLFDRWVPCSDEFYAKYNTLGLSDKDVVAIKNEIIKYQVQTARAAGRGGKHTAPWETAGQYMAEALDDKTPTTTKDKPDDNDEQMVDPTDPFGLGLETLPVSKDDAQIKVGTDDVRDLMD